MASASGNYGSQGAGSQHDSQQSCSLQKYLRAEPTITERVSGAYGAGKGGKDDKKRREDKAKDALKKFDSIWGAASK